MALPQDDPKEIFGWAMYDWAVSGFQCTVAVVFIGPYVTMLAQSAADSKNLVYLLGIPIAPTSFIPYMVSLSVGLEAIFLPILGAIADHTQARKQLWVAFTVLGAIATASLYWAIATRWWLGGVLFVCGNFCFGAAFVFYNAYLPDIASRENRDRVSSYAYALGYVGGGILLLLNLALLQLHTYLGLSTALAVRINLCSAGIWAIAWSILSFSRLRSTRPTPLSSQGNLIISGLKQLMRTVKKLHKLPNTIRFTLAYLFYNDGVQTVFAVTTLFGAVELGLSQTTLVELVLTIQFVAYFGARILGWLAEKIGAKLTLIILVLIWIICASYAFLYLTTAVEFWILGITVGFIQGGTQALSRSLFSQLIPKKQEAEFFSFYAISDRGTSWLGPLLFGLVNQISGSMRLAILSLIIFFVIGLMLLPWVNLQQGIQDADAVS